MTIFRRRSKNTVDQSPILEASPSQRKLLLGDFENKDNSVMLRPQESEDASSTSTHYSNKSVSSMDTLYDDEAALAQAFSDFSVKFDDQDDQNNVMVSMDVPDGVPVDDLTVQVNDGILRISGEVHASNNDEDKEDDDDTPKSHLTVEQAFQLDEQALDIENVTANLTNGVLTITAPKKDDVMASGMYGSLPFATVKPPDAASAAFRVIVDIPGVHPEDIHVSYANGKLRIAANRHFGRVRSFKRTILVDTQKYNADLLQTFLFNGQLTVIVPPKQHGESVSRTIEIQTAASLGAIEERDSETSDSCLCSKTSF